MPFGYDAKLVPLRIAPYAGCWYLYRYYRNTDKSHGFERETIVEAKPVTDSDEKVEEVKGTQATRVPGDNVQQYRKRVQRIQDDTSQHKNESDGIRSG